MNDYVGKRCPYCRTAFREDDEIVVCSACEMPHHKECWVDNRGCTTFGCLGTIKAPLPGVNSVTAREMDLDLSANDPGAYVFCVRCGSRCKVTDAFCCKCGARIWRI